MLQRRHHQHPERHQLTVQGRATRNFLEGVGEEVLGTFLEAGVAECVTAPADVAQAFHQAAHAFVLAAAPDPALGKSKIPSGVRMQWVGRAAD